LFLQLLHFWPGLLTLAPQSGHFGGSFGIVHLLFIEPGVM
jgi:hypothetical protein